MLLLLLHHSESLDLAIRILTCTPYLHIHSGPRCLTIERHACSKNSSHLPSPQQHAPIAAGWQLRVSDDRNGCGRACSCGVRYIVVVRLCRAATISFLGVIGMGDWASMLARLARLGLYTGTLGVVISVRLPVLLRVFEV